MAHVRNTRALRSRERPLASARGDPEYAAAYAGLADSYALNVDYRSVPVTEGFERAKEYARKALALDDTLAEAHASLAWCLFVYDWDWEGAGREFRRAIELDPRDASAHQWYGFLLLATLALGLGLHDRALDHAEAAYEDRRGWLADLERESHHEPAARASAVRGPDEAHAAVKRTAYRRRRVLSA